MAPAYPRPGDHPVDTYLAYLDDPGRFTDHILVAELEAQVAATTDPIELLHVMSNLERVKAVDVVALEDQFVATVPVYAERERLTPNDFRVKRVPEDLLIRAGLIFRPRGSSWIKRPTGLLPTASRFVEGLEGEWSIGGLSRSLRVHPGIVREAVREMLRNGSVRVVRNQGNQCLPTMYENVSHPPCADGPATHTILKAQL